MLRLRREGNLRYQLRFEIANHVFESDERDCPMHAFKCRPGSDECWPQGLEPANNRQGKVFTILIVSEFICRLQCGPTILLLFKDFPSKNGAPTGYE